MNFYNENDPRAAAWLRELIAGGLIAPGIVDERSITELNYGELTQYTQCHFFAGIGGWSYALRLAGWPDDQPVWTGSCPCQPLSCAGSRKGHADERHLWPAFYRLISKCKPATCFGEQVDGKLGREWLSGVRADLEGAGYAVGAAGLCAACVGAPHIRQRLYWVAQSKGGGRHGMESERAEKVGKRARTWGGGSVNGLVQSESTGRVAGRVAAEATGHGSPAESAGGIDRVGNSAGLGRDPGGDNKDAPERDEGETGIAGPWSYFSIVHCDDGKSRRFEPSSFPLADGIPGRVGLLRGYGNAIVPQVAALFIKAAVGSTEMISAGVDVE